MDSTPNPNTSELTPEGAAAEFAKSLIDAVRPNRAGRRKEARDARRALGRVRVGSTEYDQALVKAKRKQIRRTHGNPQEANVALFEWMAKVDEGRTATLVYGEVE